MVQIHHHHHPASPVEDHQAMEEFQHGWQTYKKAVDNNYISHREAYAALHRVLRDEFQGPFRFLDLACGDASASVGALLNTTVAHYHGIDLSEPALELARNTLDVLPCEVDLEEQDFIKAMRGRPEPADVVWIGLSMHHLTTQGKQELFGEVRNVVGDQGMFLIYEPILLDDETREAFLDRFEKTLYTSWTALTKAEKEEVLAHVRAADFPETKGTWRSMAIEQGFSNARELFEDPFQLFAVMCFYA